ncbi:M23 family metallopeptidase [candidate division WWE3 bacterium]|uniref:M23 family metallopeptidase n=1 Tax=candidate division WWE3 bacterium TaxID=2053526 RepID=A0A955LGC0_UNCKA|nr:M23 family metallopeptidase [candidate division WWE3 bacterium]
MTVLINRHKKNAQSYAIILIGLAIGLASWFTGGFGYFKTIETDAAGGPDVACIGNAVANYIDAVMAGIGSTPGVPNSDDLPNIRTLSPVFNMTSPYFQDMVNTMAGSSVYWGSLDAIGGNAYNFQNGPYIPDWVATARTNPNIGNRPMILTEIGWYELLQGSDIGTARTNLGNSASWINSQSNILGSMLFNVFNTNGGWSQYAISDSDLFTICGGAGNCNKVGANSAVYYSSSDGGFYGKAGQHGMQWTIEIANNDTNRSFPSLMPGINSALNRGITPVIRIGVQDNSGGFDTPNELVQFMEDLDALVSGEVWVIIGPNEPISECWAAPGCAYAGGGSCSGSIPGANQGCSISDWIARGPNVPIVQQQCACPPGSGTRCDPFDAETPPSSAAQGQLDGSAPGNYTFFDNDIRDWVEILPIIGATSATNPPPGGGGPPAPPPPGGCIACPILGGNVGYQQCSPTWYGQDHRGTDYLAATGTTTYAAVDGDITTASFNTTAGYGYLIILTAPDGTRYYYAHQDPNNLPALGPVSQGDPISAVGPVCLPASDPNAGPSCPRKNVSLCGNVNPDGCTNGTTDIAHLHFEIRPPGVGYDPCDAQTDPQSVTPSTCQGSCAGTGTCSGGSAQVNCDPNAPTPSGHNVKPVAQMIPLLQNSPRFAQTDTDNLQTCYNDVINQAQAAGVDPAFAMSIWIEESAASNYCEFPVVGDFGCVSGNVPQSNFQSQISCFFNTFNSYLTYGGNFQACREAGCAPGVEQLDVKKYLCTFSDGPGTCAAQTPPDQWVNSNFYNSMHAAYQIVHASSDDFDDSCILPSSDVSNSGCSLTTSCSY